MKLFPIQSERKAKPHHLNIPWSVAELAYSVYSARYGREQSLERLAERGGFYPSEMDELLPDWRNRCDLIERYKQAFEYLVGCLPEECTAGFVTEARRIIAGEERVG